MHFVPTSKNWVHSTVEVTLHINDGVNVENTPGSCSSRSAIARPAKMLHRASNDRSRECSKAARRPVERPDRAVSASFSSLAQYKNGTMPEVDFALECHELGTFAFIFFRKSDAFLMASLSDGRSASCASASVMAGRAASTSAMIAFVVIPAGGA